MGNDLDIGYYTALKSYKGFIIDLKQLGDKK